MFKELKKMIKTLKELDNSLDKRILTNQEIQDATEYADELNLLKKKISELSDKIINDKMLNKEEISHLLIDLHLNIAACISILEVIWDLLKKMIRNYGD